MLLLAIVVAFASIGRITAMSAFDTNSSKGHSSGAATGGSLVTITNSGSTNTPGYTLVIYSDGSGSLNYTRKGQTHFGTYQDKTFPAGTFATQQLHTVLQAVGDVSKIPHRGCLKSASFGTSTTITYQGKTSSDLTCLGSQDARSHLDLKDMVQQMLAKIK